MHDTATLILAIIGAVLTWTASILALAVWLTGKFRDLEKTIYREDAKHRERMDSELRDHRDRIQILELTALGVTKHP